MQLSPPWQTMWDRERKDRERVSGAASLDFQCNYKSMGLQGREVAICTHAHISRGQVRICCGFSVAAHLGYRKLPAAARNAGCVWGAGSQERNGLAAQPDVRVRVYVASQFRRPFPHYTARSHSRQPVKGKRTPGGPSAARSVGDLKSGTELEG